MLRATYHKRTVAEGGYGDLEVTWEENAELVDLSAETISMKVFPFGADVLFTKSSGITGQAPVDDVVPDPNVIVDWADDDNAELNTLDPGEYVMQFLAGDHEMMGSLIIRENAPNYGYCEVSDVTPHFGDLVVEPGINWYTYINSAADEVNAAIGQLYVLPIDLSTAASFVEPLLRKLNAQLAAGRYMLAHYSGDMGLQPYGAMLIREAEEMLYKIACGNPSLVGLPRTEAGGRGEGPTIKNHDDVSAIDVFENNYMRGGVPTVWYPGAAR